MCSLQHLDKLLSSLTTLAVGRLCRGMKTWPMIMRWIANSHLPALVLLINDTYSIACELTARHTAASSTLGGQIFVFSAHCTPKGASSKLSFLVIIACC